MEVTSNEDRFSFCDSDVESDDEVPNEVEESSDIELRALLEFSDKISHQIVSYFQRNPRKEGSCDVYEDKFSSPASGSHSYYRDILAMAQMNDRSTIPVEPVKTCPVLDFNCSWQCTGRRNASLGVGPLEDLFRVLQPIPEVLHGSIQFKNVCVVSPDGISKSHDDVNSSNMNAEVCSNIMDALDKWNSETFTQHLSDAVAELQTFGADVYMNP